MPDWQIDKLDERIHFAHILRGFITLRVVETADKGFLVRVNGRELLLYPKKLEDAKMLAEKAMWQMIQKIQKEST